MDQNESQAQAEVAKEVSTQTPQGAPADSLNNPGKEPTFEERVKGANTVEAVRSLAGYVRRTNPTEEQSPAETPAETPAEGAAKPDETPATPDEGTTAETPPAEQPAATGEAAKPSDEGDDDEVSTLKSRVRITDFDDVAKLAINLKKAAHKKGETISLAEAEKRAAAALGVSQSETPNAEAEAASKLPQSVEEAETKIKDLIAQRTKAFEEDLDFKAGNQLTNEIDALREHKLTLREQGAQKAMKEQQAYEAAFTAAEQKATSLYDFVKQADSAGFKLMAEIDRQLEENKDPLFSSPDKALVIAQMVARKLQIAPKSPNAKPAAVKPAAAAIVSKKTVPPVVGGDSRTSTTSTQAGEISSKIQAMNDREFMDYYSKLRGH